MTNLELQFTMEYDAKHIDESITNQLSKLPTDLIGRCASFLPHKSFNNLMCTCRSIYQDCTSPRLLTVLNLHRHIRITGPVSLAIFDFALYSNVKRLVFDIVNLPDHKSNARRVLNDITKMTKLRALELNMDLPHCRFSAEFIAANIPKLEFISKNKKIVNQIDELKLNISGLGNLDPILSFLREFRNVRLLDINSGGNHHGPHGIGIDDLCAVPFTMPNLIGLKLSDEDEVLGLPVLSAITTKLQFLSIRYFGCVFHSKS